MTSKNASRGGPPRPSRHPVLKAWTWVLVGSFQRVCWNQHPATVGQEGTYLPSATTFLAPSPAAVPHKQCLQTSSCRSVLVTHFITSHHSHGSISPAAEIPPPLQQGSGHLAFKLQGTLTFRLRPAGRPRQLPRRPIAYGDFPVGFLAFSRPLSPSETGTIYQLGP